MKSRIRIRIKVKRRIRILIKVIRIYIHYIVLVQQFSIYVILVTLQLPFSFKTQKLITKIAFRKTAVMFAKEIFDYPELEEHPMLSNHLGEIYLHIFSNYITQLLFFLYILQFMSHSAIQSCNKTFSSCLCFTFFSFFFLLSWK